ncbi:hypothetical protein ASE48_08525 [Mycobacterium sp. Root265]|uniref:SprT-like domain-containing protein n=1 Tax=Mycobacterium sp. Root265 TaxID=1736504 RepID=UPI00070BE589|nr:SprT-like domain-containing protein [Mycobacterium sp. Root265]KRD08599.1 hypothetical protein ASE48_08525 [Mycobacterium sp. Root265]
MTAMMTRTEHMTMAQARGEARALLAEHGLVGWTLVFDNAKKRAGQCNYRAKTVSLSRYLMATRSADETRMTLTHEVAHALTPGHHHDAVWQRKHRELGGNGHRCFQMEGVDPKAPWIGTCSKGTEHARYRAPKSLTGWSCKCNNSAKHPLTWARR